MSKQQWQKVNTIVDKALELDQEARETYIQEQCAGNERLRYQVTELLEAIEQSNTENFLEKPDSYPSNLISDLSNANDSNNESSLVGKTIGNYKITELVDHGGMGSVFLAKRADEAYPGKVALKVLRSGMDTPTNIARFERERDILAKLDHPNIARLLDGGMTDQGLPYLVMEYVEGKPLFAYCDENRLPLDQRLDLFKSICEAVQHAHNNAVIHRDLKPSNILVTDAGQVKILDFGIAKLLKSETSQEKVFETRADARILTLGYAAPEQVQNDTITTATDTYTLGTLLYELLAGVHPFEMGDKDFAEIEELILNRSPEKPSVRYGHLSQSQQKKIADQRNTNPSALSQKFTGDLNSIVSKSLRKEADRRYNSAEQLLNDLERRNKDLPIIARKDTFRYKSSKFIKRHKTALSVAAGFLLLIFSFISFYTWKITEERNRAQVEAEKAQQVSTFLTDLFRAGNPMYNPEDTLTAKTFLKRGQQRINQLDGQPEVQSQLLDVLGRAHIYLGEFDEAAPLLEQSRQIRKEVLGSSHPEFASSLSSLSLLHQKKGNFAQAESLGRSALAIQKNSIGENHEQTAETLGQLASALTRQGDYEAADSIYQKSLRIQRRVLEPNHPDIGKTLNNRSFTLRQLGEFEKSELMIRESLDIWRQNFGENHPRILESYNDLAIVKGKQGNFAAAESLYQKALDINRELYDESNPETAQLLNNIGSTIIQSGQNYVEAESYLQKSLEIRKKTLRAAHPSLAESYINLGALYIDTGRYKDARPLVQKALKIDKKEHGKNHFYVAGDLRRLGVIAKNLGSYDKAQQYLQQSLEVFDESLPPDHPFRASSLAALGEILFLKGEPKSAEKPLREALKIRRQSFDSGDFRIQQSKILLGAVLIPLDKYEESEELLKSAYKLLKQERGASDKYTKKAQRHITDLYEAWGKPELISRYELPS